MNQYHVRFVYDGYFLQVSVVADSKSEAVDLAYTVVPTIIGEPEEIDVEVVASYGV